MRIVPVLNRPPVRSVWNCSQTHEKCIAVANEYRSWSQQAWDTVYRRLWSQRVICCTSSKTTIPEDTLLESANNPNEAPNFVEIFKASLSM
jgi:hypothetical protein